MGLMTCLGVHFALTSEEETRLLAAGDNPAILAVVQALEDKADKEWLVHSDKAWEAMHRSLSNGTIYYDEGEYPLNRTVLGGKHLYDGDDFVVAYVAPNEVKDVSVALSALTEAEFRVRYDAIDPDEYDGEHGESDFKVTWDQLRSVRDLYRRAAAAGRAVVFTVDQ
jgi:hypothetical protein